MPSKFDFISPDILLREVDQSQVPAETTDDGVLIIGQARLGPSMKPVRIKDLDSLYTVFGRWPPILHYGVTVFTITIINLY